MSRYNSFLLLMMVAGLFLTAAAQKTSPARLLPAPDNVKIAPDAIVPVDFAGHSARVLFQNLQARLARKKIEGQPVYGKLTTGDLFAFTTYYFNPAQSLRAVDAKDRSIVYRGQLWRLRSSDEFPEPKIRYVMGCGSAGIGEPPPAVSSRESLVTPFKLDISPSEFWRKSVFYVESDVPKTARAAYRGYNIGKECSELYVPLRQTHYVLSFIREQPFRLFQVTERGVFSLDDYEYHTVRGAGFASWSGTDMVPEKYRDRYLKPLFVVKLVPPYIAARTFTKKDEVEKDTHIATQNQLIVDLVGVWLFDARTGEIVSQNAGDMIR